MTPRFFSSAESERILLVAPRALNAPARCRFSHLKKTSQPATSLKDREVITGVRCTRPAIRSAACLIKSSVSINAALSDGANRLHFHLEYFREMVDDPLFDFAQFNFAAK